MSDNGVEWGIDSPGVGGLWYIGPLRGEGHIFYRYDSGFTKGDYYKHYTDLSKAPAKSPYVKVKSKYDGIIFTVHGLETEKFLGYAALLLLENRGWIWNDWYKAILIPGIQFRSIPGLVEGTIDTKNYRKAITLRKTHKR